MIEPSKSFCDKKNNYLSVAELSPMEIQFVREIIPSATGEWWWFNRINVHKNNRGQGIGSNLMRQVCEWADENNYNIFDELNPYGGLNMEQLISFNKKFGFELVDGIGSIMVRYARTGDKNDYENV